MRVHAVPPDPLLTHHARCEVGEDARELVCREHDGDIPAGETDPGRKILITRFLCLSSLGNALPKHTTWYHKFS